MKKFLVTILALIYLGLSSGIAMNVHYCMGKVSSMDLFHNAKDKCSKCGMKNGTNECCKDEFKIVKLSDSHKLIANDINLFSPVALINNSISIFDADNFPTLIVADLKNNSPPSPQQISLNILYGVFRI